MSDEEIKGARIFIAIVVVVVIIFAIFLAMQPTMGTGIFSNIVGNL